MMCFIADDTCGDNRFELIAKYRAKMIEGTNIEDSPEEMAVIDSVLFRCWQMGWLDKLEDNENKQLKAENEKLHEYGEHLFDKVLELGTENEKLRELAARAWILFLKNGAVHPYDLPEVDSVRDGLRELGIGTGE